MHQPKYIYILGSAYCGSTLLEMTIGSHTPSFALGEAEWLYVKKNAADFKCACGSLLDDCGFWSRFFRENSDLEAMGFGSLAQPDKAAYRYLPAFSVSKLQAHLDKPSFQEYLSANQRFIQSVLSAVHDTSGKHVHLVDSSKTPLKALALTELSEQNMCFVHAYRRCERFLASSKKHNGTSNPVRRGLIWAANILMAKRVVAVCRNKRITCANFAYERFCAEPSGYFSSLANSLGVESTRPFTGMVQYASNHAVGGNPSRGQNQQIELDNSYRQILNSGEKLIGSCFSSMMLRGL